MNPAAIMLVLTVACGALCALQSHQRSIMPDGYTRRCRRTGRVVWQRWSWTVRPHVAGAHGLAVGLAHTHLGARCAAARAARQHARRFQRGLERKHA